MKEAFHQLCPRYSGTLTPTAPVAIRLWETFTFTFYFESQVLIKCAVVKNSLCLRKEKQHIFRLLYRRVSTRQLGVVRWCWVNFQCQGFLLICIIEGQGPTVLAVGVDVGCFDIFVAPALARCDVGVRFSVHPSVCPSVFLSTILSVDPSILGHSNDFFS